MNLSTECLEAAQVDLLLQGNLTPSEYAAAQEHLEVCEQCRGRVEETIGPEPFWGEVQRVLLHSRSALFSQGQASSAGVETNDTPTATLLDLLGPTDDPNMLGRIGPYEIIGLLGQGGMGAVFKGFDRSLNRFVAIKMLLPHLAASGAARKRFAREGQAVAAVVDDHVMAIHCVDEWQGVPYLVMTYSRGVSLQKRLSDNGPLEVREILRIGMQAAMGLAAAHAQGIIHRDIKPANMFIDQNVERVQLMDFGLARAVDDASLTRSGTLAGTPQYMSPEQARAETVDHRSDLFSLGSVMYAMCTGHAPFRAESSYSILRLITDKEPRPIREMNPDVPEWLCAIISKLMAKQASDRFASAQEVAQLLKNCLAHVQQPTSTALPDSLVPHTQGHRLAFCVTRRGVMTMLGTIGMTLLGMVLWQATEAPDVSGQWTSDEWGSVVLEAKEPGQYEGTFTGLTKHKPAYEILDIPVAYSEGFGAQAVLTKTESGNIHLKWSRVERRFNGTWRKGINRSGKISLRLVGTDIRGAWTTTKGAQKESDGPRLADLIWKRIVVTLPDGGHVLLGGSAVGDKPASKRNPAGQNESSSLSDLATSEPSDDPARKITYSVPMELLSEDVVIELQGSNKVSLEISDGVLRIFGEKREVESAVEMIGAKRRRDRGIGGAPGERTETTSNRHNVEPSGSTDRQNAKPDWVVAWDFRYTLMNQRYAMMRISKDGKLEAIFPEQPLVRSQLTPKELAEIVDLVAKNPQSKAQPLSTIADYSLAVRPRPELFDEIKRVNVRSEIVAAIHNGEVFELELKTTDSYTVGNHLWKLVGLAAVGGSKELPRFVKVANQELKRNFPNVSDEITASHFSYGIVDRPSGNITIWFDFKIDPTAKIGKVVLRIPKDGQPSMEKVVFPELESPSTKPTEKRETTTELPHRAIPNPANPLIEKPKSDKGQESEKPLSAEGNPKYPQLPIDRYVKSGAPLADQTWPMPPWGEERDGLRVGLRVIGDAFINGEVQAELWLRNSSSKDITFASCHRVDVGFNINAKDMNGKDYHADITSFRGYPVYSYWLLPPGHIMKLKEFKLKFGSRKNDLLERGWASLDLPPGDYKLLAVWTDTTSRGAREREWTGKLTSGEVNLSVAASDAKLEVPKSEK